MLNAVQGVDMLMGGFHNAMAIARERMQERADQSAYSSLWAQHDDLVVRFNALLEDARRLEKRLEAKNQAYEALQEQLVYINGKSTDYTATLIRRIDRLDERLQRESANAYSMTAMRDVLLAEVMAFGDPAMFTSMNPDRRAGVMEAAWTEFMTTQNVRLGVPKAV